VRAAVVVSIIGIERFTGGYGAAKVAHEQAWRSGPIPVRIVRAAQFHEFVGQLLEWGSRGEVSVVPEMRTQIVAARAVAEVIADVIEADAAGAAAPGRSRWPGRGRRPWRRWRPSSPPGRAARPRCRAVRTRRPRRRDAGDRRPAARPRRSAGGPHLPEWLAAQ
jgi:hypothetical protein